MTPTKAGIRGLVLASIEELLGETCPPITEDTDPIKDLGLESFDGIDFACVLSEKLAWSIPSEVNPFVDDRRNRSRKVREIVDLLEHLIAGEECLDDKHEFNKS